MLRSCWAEHGTRHNKSLTTFAPLEPALRGCASLAFVSASMLSGSACVPPPRNTIPNHAESAAAGEHGEGPALPLRRVSQKIRQSAYVSRLATLPSEQFS